MARRGQRGSGNTRTAPRQQRGNDGIIPVLAKAVREVEAEAERGRIRPGSRTRFQVIALLVREERARVKADTEHGEAWKEEQLRRLDGVATILAKTSVRDPSLLALLAEDAVVSDSARDLMRDMLKAAGFEVPDVEEVRAGDARARRRPREARGPAVGGLAPAGQPVPGARLLRRRGPAAHPPAVVLGAARPALPLLRVRRQVVVHAAARGARPARSARARRAST